MRWVTYVANLRYLEEKLTHISHTGLETTGDRAFESVAPTLWNALPLDFRSAVSIDMFKKQSEDSPVQTGLCPASCVWISSVFIFDFFLLRDGLILLMCSTL